MKKLDYASLVLGILSLVWMLVTAGQFSAATPPSISLATTPAPPEVIPAHTPVELRLVAQDSQGRPLQGTAQVALQAPRPNPWLTSDFPWVEGTSLLKLEAPLENGALVWSQVLPIRGKYVLEAQVVLPSGQAIAPVQQQLTLNIPENPVKYRNALILVAILLVTGGYGGWVIGRGAATPQAQGAGLPSSVQRLFLWGIVITATALLILNITAELASSHAGHSSTSSHSHTPDLPTAAKSPVITAELRGDQFAFVGQPAHQTVVVTTEDDTALPNDLRLKVEAVDLEANAPVFSYSGPLQGSKFSWDWQFYDAAPHQIRATLSASGATELNPIQLGHQVEVSGKEPPLWVRFVTLGYWLIIFTGAMLAGYYWAIRKSPSAHS